MANTIRENWTTWVAGTQTDDPRIGVNGGKNNIMCYQFTTGATGASHLSFEMGYTRLYDGSYIDICWYVGTSATSHTNANKAQGSESNGTVTFDSNHHSFTVDADVILLPNTTYYLWFFPAVETYGFYSGSRADSDNDLTLSGDAGLVYIDSGSAMGAYQVYIDNGSSWDMCLPYADNGSSWDLLT